MRSNVGFSRFSAVAILIALAFLVVGGGRLGGYSTAAQGATTAATAAGTGGAIPPCPEVAMATQAATASGNAQGCVPVADNALFMDILTNPSNYYVNVHNADFPGGVVRGQIEPQDHDATGTK